MARRGFLAEIQHQVRRAAREHEREQRAAVREHRAALRRAEQAKKDEQQALERLSRAETAERRRLEKEARDAHVAAMEAEVERRNFELSDLDDDLDALLVATLDIDDYVDLETLRASVQHPPFRQRPGTPDSPCDPVADPPRPVLVTPTGPRGLAGLFGRRKHNRRVALAKQKHERELARWQAHRITVWEAERAQYVAECAAREADAAAQNKTLDELIANLGYGAVDAVQEYVSIVLSNSVYPESFSVTHEFSFEPSSAELRLRVQVLGPDKLPAVKSYKYMKSADEITATPLSVKACRNRYANAVHRVALRSIHEVFEADRRGIIRSISLEVGASTVSPATGRDIYVPFVIAGAERDSFLEFDLSAVSPAKTLEHLNASLSKNPYDLVPADTSDIRRT